MTITFSSSGSIRTGEPFKDQHGKVAQLHGVGVMAHAGRYYAWGEEKSNGGTFTSVECYSTTNFSEWRHEGTSLGSTTEGDTARYRVVERPKVTAATAPWAMKAGT
ncbi:hypothetical protein [Arthrobacter sp. ISL-72]|uniref:hypothetical protein n=1 Tax=Arthrobacter sp. ISL-72 TaxID=2819114 RepID=UPI002035DA18|nr:hypothetical protein [Arthrobacter sp. ISL-72]